MSGRIDILPPSLPPRGLSRVEAAAYIGVSGTLFDEMVKDGRMPQLTGHTTSKEVVRYTRGARQKVLAAKAMARFDKNKN